MSQSWHTYKEILMISQPMASQSVHAHLKRWPRLISCKGKRSSRRLPYRHLRCWEGLPGDYLIVTWGAEGHHTSSLCIYWRRGSRSETFPFKCRKLYVSFELKCLIVNAHKTLCPPQQNRKYDISMALKIIESFSSSSSTDTLFHIH